MERLTVATVATDTTFMRHFTSIHIGDETLCETSQLLCNILPTYTSVTMVVIDLMRDITTFM